MKDPISAILATKGRVVYTVPPEVTVAEAVARMNQEKVGCLVVSRGGRLKGIFTERDVLVRIVGHNLDPARTRVAEVMTSEVEIIDSATKVKKALVKMTEKHCRHLPVVEEGELVGMVSIGDLTRWLVRHQRQRIADLERTLSASGVGG